MNFKFVDQMEEAINDKMDSEVAEKEDDLRMEIDRMINEWAGHSSEYVMESIRRDSGWNLMEDESAYSEIYSELEEKMRNRLGMN